MDGGATGPDDAALVVRVRDGDPDAFGELYDRWFDRVHDVAFRVTHDSASAADVAQDAFLAAWQQLPKLENPEVFGGWLLRIARNRALDHVRRASRATPRDAEAMAMIERQATATDAAPAGFRVEARVATADDPARAAEDDEVADLVWGAVEALGERDAEVLDLTLRHGMSPAEIADVVGTNRNAANQMVHRARAHLGDAVRARVLWRRGRPECGDLADALAAAGVDRFGAEAVRVTTAHADGCPVCSTRRQLRLDPAHLFAAIPMVGAPALVKQKVAHALMADGVPLQGSAAVVAGPGGPGLPDGGPPDGRPADGAAQGADAHPPTDATDATGAPTQGTGGDATVATDTASEGAAGDAGGPPAPDAARSHRLRRAALVTAAVVGVLVLALGVVVAVAERLDHGTVVEREVSSATRTTGAPATTTTTTAPATTTTSAPEETVELAPVVTTAPPRVPDTTQPPEPPAPPAATVSISVSPATRPVFQITVVPVLTWSSANAASVTVTGPNGFEATGTSGSLRVCPPNGVNPQNECVPGPPQSYEYTATARDAEGAVVATASAVLRFTST